MEMVSSPLVVLCVDILIYVPLSSLCLLVVLSKVLRVLAAQSFFPIYFCYLLILRLSRSVKWLRYKGVRVRSGGRSSLFGFGAPFARFM
jgi:hypothetical protein